MKILACILMLGMFVSCSHNKTAKTDDQTVMRATASVSPNLNERDMRIINLQNIKIIDSEGQNTFPYSVSRIKASNKLLAELLEASGDDVILSGVFAAKKGQSSFKNIYAFTTQRIDGPDSITFRLNVVFQNKSGSMSLIDYDISEANPRELKVTNGPSDSLEHLRVLAETSFFPF